MFATYGRITLFSKGLTDVHVCATVLPAKSDRDDMFCLQSY